MAKTGKTRVLESLILEILKGAKPEGVSCSFEEANTHLSSVARLDYGAGLRHHFDRTQLQQIIVEMRQSVPDLNRRVFATTDLRELGKIAARLGARLLATRFTGREGLELRGFYADHAMFRRRPLICVNTVNHPVAVAAAFWHEVGHHLSRRILGSRASRALNFTTNCHDHLSSLSETVADVVMVLGGYPRSVARQLFGGSHAGCVERNVDLLVARARAHVHTACGFDFTRRISTHENLCYLAGMIHVAKLRAAVFREFEI